MAVKEAAPTSRRINRLSLDAVASKRSKVPEPPLTELRTRPQENSVIAELGTAEVGWILPEQREALASSGLFVDLGPWQFHLPAIQ